MPANDQPEATNADPSAAARWPRGATHALTTAELSARRRELEHTIKGISADAPVQADLRRALDDVLAEEESRARITDV